MHIHMHILVQHVDKLMLSELAQWMVEKFLEAIFALRIADNDSTPEMTRNHNYIVTNSNDMYPKIICP